MPLCCPSSLWQCSRSPPCRPIRVCSLERTQPHRGALSSGVLCLRRGNATLFKYPDSPQGPVSNFLGTWYRYCGVDSLSLEWSDPIEPMLTLSTSEKSRKIFKVSDSKQALCLEPRRCSLELRAGVLGQEEERCRQFVGGTEFEKIVRKS